MTIYKMLSIIFNMNNVKYEGREAYFKVVGVNKYGLDIVEVDGVLHTKDILLYRYKFEKENKITIPKGMVVHHIDGDSLNNDKANLALMTREAHSRYHTTILRAKGGDV